MIPLNNNEKRKQYLSDEDYEDKDYEKNACAEYSDDNDDDYFLHDDSDQQNQVPFLSV